MDLVCCDFAYNTQRESKIWILHHRSHSSADMTHFVEFQNNSRRPGSHEHIFSFSLKFGSLLQELKKVLGLVVAFDYEDRENVITIKEKSFEGKWGPHYPP